MRKFTILCLVLVSSFFLMSPYSFSQSTGDPDHIKWVESSLKEMETVKVGMTRSDLLKVFREEGGVSTRKQRTYAYRLCPYFKVTVEFKPVGDERAFRESADDEIVKISGPFLQRMIID